MKAPKSMSSSLGSRRATLAALAAALLARVPTGAGMASVRQRRLRFGRQDVQKQRGHAGIGNDRFGLRQLGARAGLAKRFDDQTGGADDRDPAAQRTVK